MKEKNVNVFVNIMTSGKMAERPDEAMMDTVVRYILLNSLIFIGGSLLFGFGFDNLAHGEILKGFFDLIMGMMTVLAFIVLRTNTPFVASGIMTVVPFMCLCAFFAQSGGAQGSGVLWSYSFPMMAIFLLGMRTGIILSLVLFVIVVLSVFVPGFSPLAFKAEFAYRTVGVYALVLACTIVYEQTKITKDKWVAKLTRQLKSERDEMEVMKDNLSVGLFLMDGDYRIQPQYSQALEKILSGSDADERLDLQGKSFVEILSNSVKEKERETLKDYFTMVINRSFDAQMLEEINPLHQFTYVGPGGEEKTLRCSFAPVDNEDGSVYILGTVSDNTREVALQRQLSEEESKRNEEMRALFEVIHVEPRVLNDFIEDTEYEFDRINTILKDQSRTSREVMVEMFQSVHAIKSNSVILGLASFGAKLHALEDEIKALRERSDICFDEVLHVTFELEKLMRVKDGFKAVIDKIRSFRVGENRMQEEHVLVQTLEKVIDKAAADLGKKARLSVKIDAAAMEAGPRRVIKEVLTQLVRNAMYHGIESPDGRATAGKDEAGLISLSISYASGKIVIDLSDDGKGIDFNAIRAKAESMNLVADRAQLEDRNALTQLIFAPGFSTAETANMHAGRGIGLNLVRERIKEMKGAIKLQTDEGKGTTFRITIPVEVQASGAQIA